MSAPLTMDPKDLRRMSRSAERRRLRTLEIPVGNGVKMPDTRRFLSASNEFGHGTAIFERKDGIWRCLEASDALNWVRTIKFPDIKNHLIRRGFSWSWSNSLSLPTANAEVGAEAASPIYSTGKAALQIAAHEEIRSTDHGSAAQGRNREPCSPGQPDCFTADGAAALSLQTGCEDTREIVADTPSGGGTTTRSANPDPGHSPERAHVCSFPGQQA